MKYIFTFILSVLFSFNVFAIETCARTATINFQEVLVDTNSSGKGEGLRFQLEKDPIALEYLNLYQKQSATYWPSAVLGSAGTGILLLGLLSPNSPDRNNYLIFGGATVLINYFIAKTFELQNESNLIKAINEYNKRNIPQIFFKTEEKNSSIINPFQFKIGLFNHWSF